MRADSPSGPVVHRTPPVPPPWRAALADAFRIGAEEGTPVIYVTSGIRWAIVIWCAVAAAVVAAGALQGARPAALGLIVAAMAVPLAVMTALTRFRPAARTATQVLYDKAKG
jgi:hypothetical protein